MVFLKIALVFLGLVAGWFISSAMQAWRPDMADLGWLLATPFIIAAFTK